MALPLGVSQNHSSTVRFGVSTNEKTDQQRLLADGSPYHYATAIEPSFMENRRMRLSIWIGALIVFAYASDATGQTRDDDKTCSVLSVGGLKGLAHVGAIDEIKGEGVRIDCVFSNSMGSVIGSLNVTNSQAKPPRMILRLRPCRPEILRVQAGGRDRSAS
jgi:hypothetical protein